MKCSAEWDLPGGVRLGVTLGRRRDIQRRGEGCPRDMRMPAAGTQAMNTPIRKGKVYLMGAGPGHPDLLTVQAVNILRGAEVVLHDHLVAQEILDLLPAWTQVRNVGKRCGHAGMAQEQIHALLIAAAREGKQVVRLKGGDPLLFGRVGEEMEALARAGVEFRVIPGVTSAMAAAAAAKVPLTDRRYASRLIFVSNHSAGNVSPEWGDAVVKDATYAVYMPGKNYGEIAAKMIEGGLDAATPCVIVANATLSGEQIQRTSLEELALEQRLPAPSLLIVGQVARALPEFQAEEDAAGWNEAKPREVILDLRETRPQEEEIVG